MSSNPPPILEQFRAFLRRNHYALTTEKNYIDWVNRFIRYHAGQRKDWKHPSAMGAIEVEAYLNDLVMRWNVSASTQKQALCALALFYKNVIANDLSDQLTMLPASLKTELLQHRSIDPRSKIERRHKGGNAVISPIDIAA